jgi:pyruvate-ferredoxin/flavodoxin oxidoreductase
MPSWSSIAADWMRRRFGREPAVEAPHPGHEVLATGAQAIVATEALIAEGLYRFSLGGPESNADQKNAFDALVRSFGARGHGGATTAAGGLALSGRRATVFVAGDGAHEACGPLGALVARHVPLVLHVTGRLDPLHPAAGASGRASIHALAATGAVVLVAQNVQHAVDLALVARRVSEQALVPCVVAMDGAETAWAPRNVSLPEPGLIREYLGRPGDEIEVPTPSQRMLFGDHRRRVPAWFDLDRPVAHGVAQAGPELSAAIVGRRFFFADHVETLLFDAMEELAAKTGRKLSTVRADRVRGEQHVIVACGAAAETARAAADHLANRDAHVGVVSITALRPFPAKWVAEYLGSASTVTVLERSEDHLANAGVLAREVGAALSSAQVKLVTATYGLGGEPLAAADLVTLCNADTIGEREVIHLGLPPLAGQSTFPTRQVHLEAIGRGYPALSENTPVTSEVLELAPKGAKVVSLWQGPGTREQDWLGALAEELHRNVGPQVRAYSYGAEESVHVGRVIAAKEPFEDPGAKTPVDLALIADIDLTDADTPFSELRNGAHAVLSTQLEGADLWTAIPEGWRATIRARNLRVWSVEGGANALVTAATRLLAGDRVEQLQPLHWKALPGTRSAPRTPAAVQRFKENRAVYDNVPHFWNTIAAPRMGGEAGSAVPEPLLVAGVVPSSTAAFHDARRGRTRLPTIDPQACTGCGKCWVACPDSAIMSVSAGVGSLLDSAADLAARAGAPRTEQAEKLKRAHRQLAARIDGQLAKGGPGALAMETVRGGFDWLVEKMGIADTDKPAFEAAFESTAAELGALPLSVTDLFFTRAHAAKKGTGELLLLAIDSRSCQACGACETACPESAITTAPQTAELVQASQRAFEGWNRLPDTAGATIARVSAADAIGPLAGVLLSRHCSTSLVGGDYAEPGSGERLGLRLVAAIVEHRSQRRLGAILEKNAELRKRVREAIRDSLAESIVSDDLSVLDQALESVPMRPKNLGTLVGRLDELGVRNTVDRDYLQGLVAVAKQLEERERQIGEGADGLGRARFGVVLASQSVGEWAARFPRNSFAAPVAVDLAGNGPELARGLLTGLNAAHVDEARTYRRADLLLDHPSDLEAKIRDLDDLGWDDLSSEEREARAPLLVVVGPDAVSEQTLPSLSKLLGSEEDITVILLDGRERVPTAADPVMLALSHRRAFVVSTSVAYPDHLFEGVDAALSFSGPALIHIHAPSPARHGFATDQTVERARGAVQSRLAPLLRYDPNEPGVYGSRLSLNGNPDPGSAWSVDPDGLPWTPARWALGEDRFGSELSPLSETAPSPTSIDTWVALDRDQRATKTPTVVDTVGATLAVGHDLAELCRERYEQFRTLQELAGVVTPFTGAVRAQVESELAVAHRAELDALRAEYESKLVEQATQRESAVAARLKARLLELSALPSKRRPGAHDEEGS